MADFQLLRIVVRIRFLVLFLPRFFSRSRESLVGDLKTFDGCSAFFKRGHSTLLCFKDDVPDKLVSLLDVLDLEGVGLLNFSEFLEKILEVFIRNSLGQILNDESLLVGLLFVLLKLVSLFELLNVQAAVLEDHLFSQESLVGGGLGALDDSKAGIDGSAFRRRWDYYIVSRSSQICLELRRDGFCWDAADE